MISPDTSRANPIAILFLCINPESIELLFSYMQTASIRLLISELELLEAVDDFERETALLDSIDLLLRTQQPGAPSYIDRMRMLRFSLDPADLPELLQAIATDRAGCQVGQARDRHARMGRHKHSRYAIQLQGIRLRLNDRPQPESKSSSALRAELVALFETDLERQAEYIARQIDQLLASESGSTHPAERPDLNGRRKTTLALLQMDDTVLALLMEHLAKSEQQAMAFEIMNLTRVEAHEQLESLCEYIELLLNLKLIDGDQIDAVEDAIDHIRLAIPGAQVDQSTRPDEGWPSEPAPDKGPLPDTIEAWLQAASWPEPGSRDKPEFQPDQTLSDARSFLLEVCLATTLKQPRLVARAVRHLFRQVSP
ncbi:MAG: hypothetical protein KDK39_15815 [Leptospiraceae bacterium]|nr:hypothetical protein [Leptospiraceae bacterium]